MIDWHCHILPGLDDGPALLEESLEMAAMLSAAGFTRIHCTPHCIRGYYDADNGAVLHSVSTLQKYIVDRGIRLRLLPGREYYLDEFFTAYLHDPIPLGETNLILIEIPDQAPHEFIKESCFRIVTAGYRPLIAHPERCAHFALPGEKPAGKWDAMLSLFSMRRDTVENGGDDRFSRSSAESLLAYLRDIGCFFQGNAGSFRGLYGPRKKRYAERLARAGVYTHFGTDAHSAGHVRDLFAALPEGEYGMPLTLSAMFGEDCPGSDRKTGTEYR